MLQVGIMVRSTLLQFSPRGGLRPIWDLQRKSMFGASFRGWKIFKWSRIKNSSVGPLIISFTFYHAEFQVCSFSLARCALTPFWSILRSFWRPTKSQKSKFWLASEMVQEHPKISEMNSWCCFEVYQGHSGALSHIFGFKSDLRRPLKGPTMTKRRTSPNRHLTPFLSRSFLIFTHPAHRVGQIFFLFCKFF